MEKELSIAELSQLWGVSVPTTWNRVRKEGLTTFTKKNKSNKEISYVTISDEILNSYFINNINNVNNVVNNGYYEEMLTDNNLNKGLNQDISTTQPETLKDIINTITTIHNDYNNRLQQVNEELINYKSKTLLLEDAKGREGYYINEINELKKENNRNKLYNKLLITFITILLIFITGFITYNIAKSDKVSDTVVEKSVQVEPKSDQVSDQVEQPKQQPKPIPKVVKRK